jgi:LruC domain-containing protein
VNGRARAILPLAALIVVSGFAEATTPVCDHPFVSVAYAPAQGAFAMLMFEDNWPENGDLDFNDQAISYNYVLGQDAAGKTIELRATFTVLANLAGLHNGLYLHLPVPATAAGTLVVARDGVASAQAPREDESDLVVVLADDTHPLLSKSLAATIRFSKPVDLDVSRAPFDLFIARTGQYGHQIHLSPYGGTDGMDRSLFGSADDGSTDSRHFVNRNGLPFALNVPDFIPWPQETVSIDRVYPDIVGFAASGGTQNRDWYASTDRDLSLAVVASPPALPGACDEAPPPQAGDGGSLIDTAGSEPDAGPASDTNTSADRGSIRYEWALTAASRPSDCAGVLGTTMRLMFGPPGAYNHDSVFPQCADGFYVLDNLAPGDYGVAIALLNADGVHVSVSTARTITVRAAEVTRVFETLDVAPLYLPDAGIADAQPDAALAGRIRYEWAVTAVGRPTDCSGVGGETMRLMIGPPGAYNRESQYAPCADGSYVLEGVAPGEYDVGIAVLGPGGVHMSVSLPRRITVRSGETTNIFESLDVASIFIPDAGISSDSDPESQSLGGVRYEWALTTAGRPSTCGEVGGVRMRLMFGPTGSADRNSRVAPCLPGSYVLDGLEQGKYDVAMAALDSWGNPIAMSHPRPVTVRAGEVASASETLDAARPSVPDAGSPPDESPWSGVSCADDPEWYPGGPFAPGIMVAHGIPRRLYECRPSSPGCMTHEPGFLDSWQYWIERGQCADSLLAPSPRMPCSVATTDGLIARWAFDDGSGSSAVNSVTQSPAGTSLNAAWVDPGGPDICGGLSPFALRFRDGTGATMVGNDFPTEASAVTISLWASYGEPGPYSGGTLASLGRPDQGRSLYVVLSSVPVGAPQVLKVFYGSMAEAVCETPAPPPGWHHIAYTYDGQGRHSLFVDGQLGCTRVAAPASDERTTLLQIGNSFKGDVDDVRLYDRALSATGVSQVTSGK